MPIVIDPLWLLLAQYAAQVALTVTILLRPRLPAAVRLAWLVVIFAFPLVGMVAYLLVGEVRLGRRRARHYREATRVIEDHIQSLPLLPPATPAEVPDRFRKIAYLAETADGRPVRGGNSLRLFGDTDGCMDSLVADIDAATHHCHLLFYIFLCDRTGRRVAEALARAAERGVRCRLLVDAVGSRSFLGSDLRRDLEARSVRVVSALPAGPARALLARMDLRNHRKIAVVDGRIGYTGSQNVADADFAPKRRFAPWMDAMVRIHGPGVQDLQTIFAEDWWIDTHEAPADVLVLPPHGEIPGHSSVQFLASGPTSDITGLRHLVQSICHQAEEELILTTPYFVPDEGTLSALTSIATSGVTTMLVVPARNDSPLVAAASRSFYEELLEAGVAIHEYQGGLLHAKTITVDRDLALVSTANMDRRSFELNFESSMVVYDGEFASELRLLQMTYVNGSRPVSLADWRRRRWWRKLEQNGAGLVGPLL